MAGIVNSVALTAELLIASLLMIWGFRMMREGWMQQRKLIWMEAQAAYTRSWKEIEMMLDEARDQMYEQKSKFHHRKRVGDKAGCRRAAAKFARAKGMVDCWFG